MLLTDTNILQRVSLGRAMTHVEQLRRRHIKLGTTVHNAVELRNNLAKRGLSALALEHRVQDTLAPFELLLSDEYEHRRQDADARLRRGGKSDWPLLAAALAMDAQIWSEDTDFFGTGVPVWSTANICYVERD